MADEFRIVRCENASDVEAFFTVHNRVMPLHAVDAIYIGTVAGDVSGGDRWIARIDGEVVAGASYDAWEQGVFAQVVVLPQWRGRGLGRRLWQLVKDRESEQRTNVTIDVDYDDERSVRLAEACGFVRPTNLSADCFVIDVATASTAWSPNVRVLDVDELSDSAFRDEFVAIANIANERFPDIEPPDPQWYVDNERSRYAHGGVTLLHEDAGELVGACQAVKSFALNQIYSEYTLVRPDDRGRGIGLALKQAQLAWAQKNGVERIVTDVPDSDPMRRILRSLGYRPWQRAAMMRGPA